MHAALAVFFLFLLMIGRPPRSPLFPSTTLFRSRNYSSRLRFFKHFEPGLGGFTEPFNRVTEPGIWRIFDVIHKDCSNDLASEAHSCKHVLPMKQAYQSRWHLARASRRTNCSGTYEPEVSSTTIED